MQFTYVVKGKDGQVQNGVIEAVNEGVASKQLHEQGLFVLEIKKLGSNLPGGIHKSISIPFIGGKVSLKDRIIFTQQLAMMIKAGLPLMDAFGALQEQTENSNFAQIISEVSADVKGGKPMSESLEKYPKVFSKLYVAMVRSGEKSGKLDENLERLSDQLQKDYELISKIKAALTYPVVVIVALFAIVIVMLIFVVPQMKAIFSDIGAELPIITKIVLGTSDVILKYWYIFIAIILVIVIGLRLWTRTDSGKMSWDKFKLRIPLIGPLIKKIYMARFNRTMGSLVASGLPMLDIIDTVGEVVNNQVYQDAFKRIGKDIENGIQLSESLKKQHIFPPMIYHLVAVGEKSGKLDYVLLSMANFFDKEVETQTSNLSTLIEPILIVIIGAGVGLVVASVIMPIYSLVNVM
ncbi:MAG: type secretory pathway, component PulF [Candidatus Berkelbacteria bacterium]|nr:type secretory pathway, component PulF [Candidatus Berkelbacteria bacterium]